MTTSNIFDKMANWIRKNGGFVSPSVKVVSSNIDGITSRSIYTIKDIKEKDSLMRIPLKCKIHPDLVYDIPNIDKWIQNDSKNMIKTQLFYRIVISLVYQKSLGKKSFYYPFIRTLPKSTDFKNHVIFNNTPENISDWKKCSSSFANEVQTTLDAFENLLDFISTQNKEFPIINLEKFGNVENILKILVKWAYVIFITRGWYIHGCVPYMDLFNHKSDSQMTAQYHETNIIGFEGQSQYITYKSYEVGEEIFIHYGIYDSKKLLRRYGFNPDEEIKYMEMSVEYNPKIPLQHYIANELKRYEFPKEKLLLTTRTPSSLLIQYLRIISLDYYDISKVFNIENYFQTPFSNNNELSVFKTLLKLINNLRNTEYTTERFNDCNMLLETTDNYITQNLCKIVLNEYNLIKTNILWVHGNWIARLETPMLQHLLTSLSTVDIA